MHYYDTYRKIVGICFTVNIIGFGTKYDANLDIMSCQVSFYQHQDPKNNWRGPFKILFLARFSLVSLSIHPRSRRDAERIDQQQQQQQRKQQQQQQQQQ